ncbi:GerAB/ArcD/ProY family transporter [Paenibacillus xylaniclasticus]|uniref:GerAB/ArcD/ProY family transporter n=1 Tax=Paenibacillus xylaniclasticus TaxID=588083 RepID=UPI000FDC96C4|nr:MULTISPECIES: endospore germination permease [Paenibacillus]GFN32708.1 hypothetical protein PCURB6_29680 [Paenibacillus curdlanolyticus]
MLEQGRISAAQLAILTGMAVTATSLLTAPGLVAIDAKQDMWLSPIWISPIGLLIVWILWKLNQAYPNQTLIEYSVTVLGRFVGSIVGASYLMFVIFATANALRQFTDFVKETFLLSTPSVVISSCMLLVCWLVARSGIEIVARLSATLLPLVGVFILMIYMPSLWDMHLERMMPIMDHGLQPSAMGAFRLLSWIPTFSIMNFYMPYVSNRKNLLLWSLGNVILFTLTMCITFVIVYTIIGATTINYLYPFMVLARFTSFTEFFEHLESLVMMIWVIQIVIHISFGLYGSSLGVAQLFGLTAYKPIVLPICSLILLFSFWGIDNALFVSSPSIIVYYSIFGLILPLLLFVAHSMKRLFIDSDKAASPPSESAV